MNNRTLAIALLTAAGTAATTMAQSQYNQIALDMDKRDRNVIYTESNETFLKSWHSNEVYLTKSEYFFDTELKVSQNKDERGWLEKTLATLGTKSFETIQKGHFEGKAIAQSIVFHEFPDTALLREYKSVIGDGDWFGETAVASEVMREMVVGFKKTVDNPEARKTIRDTIFGFLNLFDSEIAQSVDLILEWGESAWDVGEAWAGKNIGTIDDDGILKIDGKSPFGKYVLGGDEGGKVVAMAKSFSQGIADRRIAICYNGTETFDAGEIQNVADAKNPGASFDDFYELVKEGKEIKKADPLYPVLSRESMSPTKDLFDGAIRKIGDQWEVDAGVFSSFLHPDLKGCFTGHAVLEYVEDTTYRAMVSKGVRKTYDVRKLRVVPKGRVNGRSVETKFEYDEIKAGGRFRASYDSSSEFTVYVDKKSGHVIRARGVVRADKVDALPSLKLLRGFIGNGSATLEITFSGDVLDKTGK